MQLSSKSSEVLAVFQELSSLGKGGVKKCCRKIEAMKISPPDDEANFNIGNQFTYL